MKKYHKMINQIIVKPKDEFVDSDMTTFISVELGFDDEHVVGVHQPQSNANIFITMNDWRYIKEGIEQMLGICDQIDDEISNY